MNATAHTGLEAIGVSKRYGGLTVSDDINLRLAPGDRCALIGPNGAGKTTFANLVTGSTAPSAGKILLDGRDITPLDEASRVRAGIAKTFQITTLFRGLSVRENLRLPILERRGRTWNPVVRADRQAEVEAEIDALLEKFDLHPVADHLVSSLAYGLQRLVEMALTLALKPRVLILDEPAAGVPGSETRLIIDAIAVLPADLAVLIIEHDMNLVFSVASSIIVLVQGRVLVQGPPAQIAADPEVRRLYLGEGHG